MITEILRQAAAEFQRQKGWKYTAPEDVDRYFRCEVWGPDGR